jgi:hypothetical protein
MRPDLQDEFFLVLSILVVIVASGFGAYYYATWVIGQ